MGSRVRLSDRLAGLSRVFLVESCPQSLHEGQVQRIQPHRRFRAVIAVIMPGPDRCQEKSRRFQAVFLTVNDRVRTVATYDKAQSGETMPVSRRHFTWHDHLKRGVESMGNAIERASTRVNHA